MNALLFAENCITMHGAQAWRLAISLAGNAADADDVVQQAWIVAWRKADAAPRDAWPWLAGIISNEARNLRRKRALRSHAPLTEESAMSLDRRPERTELARLLDEALQTLPEDQREAIVLTHLCGFTQQQAAEVADVPLNTLKARVRRGLEAMRQRLGAREEEITLGLAALPIAMPPGGLSTAQIAWTAGVQQHAASAATAAVATSKVKMLALGTAAALAIAALLLVLLQDQMRPSPAINELSHSQPGDGASQPRLAGAPRGIQGRQVDGPGRRPAGMQGQQHEPSDDSGRKPPPDAGEAGAPGDSNATIESERPEAETPSQETGSPEPGPESGAAAGGEVSPVLWIRDWPPKNLRQLESPGSTHVAKAIRAFEKVWDSKEDRPESRLKTLQDLPNGDEDIVAPMIRALASDLPAYQSVAIRWIESQSDRRCLKVLEKLLWDAREGIAGPRLVRAMFRNPHWVDHKKWEAGVDNWVRTQKWIDPVLVSTLLIEMGHVRGDYGSNENRERALLLLDAAEQLERKREPDAMVLRSLRVGLENLARAGFVSAPEREKTQKKLRDKGVKSNALMKRQRTLKAAQGQWDVTSIDVEGARAHPLALVILCEPEHTDLHWLPWMIEADAHFRCYLLSYRGWTKEVPVATAAEHCSLLAQDVAVLIKQLKLERFGVLAQGCMAPIGFELSGDLHSKAEFAALDAWKSRDQIIASLKGSIENETELHPAKQLLLADLRGQIEVRIAADPFRSSWQSLWWLNGDSGGRATHDAYARQVLDTPVRDVYWNPLARFVNYEFGDNGRVSKPVLVLSCDWPTAALDGDHPHEAFERPNVAPPALTTRPAWATPAEHWMAAIVDMLTSDRVIK